jgi:hypothetical protein
MSISNTTVIIARLYTHTIEESPASSNHGSSLTLFWVKSFRLHRCRRVVLLMARHTVCHTARVISIVPRWQHGSWALLIGHAPVQRQPKQTRQPCV